MNVLILGSTGNLGPHVVKALEAEHLLRLADIAAPEESDHEFVIVDISDLDQVVSAAEGMDAIVNLSVLRHDRRLAFDVSARGAYNMMAAAVEHGIPRVINTGPHFTITGPSYERFDHRIGPDVPAQPGTNLYALTKSLGHEICRVFSEGFEIHVINLLFYMFREPDDPADGQHFTPFTVSWPDAARAFDHALSIDLASLDSRCEVFFVFADIPHDKFSNEKAKRVLGWQPKDRLSQFWKKE